MAQPNIVLVHAGDMGFSDLGCCGSDILKRLIGMFEDWADKSGALPWSVLENALASPRMGTKHIHDID